jgi:hypothetical protein
MYPGYRYPVVTVTDKVNIVHLENLQGRVPPTANSSIHLLPVTLVDPVFGHETYGRCMMSGKFYVQFLAWPDWVKFLLLVILTSLNLTLVVIFIALIVEHAR